MTHSTLFVIESNCFISEKLTQGSTSARAFDRVIQLSTVELSSPLLNEYTVVIYRQKLDRYLSEDLRKAALGRLEQSLIFLLPTEKTEDCRDPNDKSFYVYPLRYTY